VARQTRWAERVLADKPGETRQAASDRDSCDLEALAQQILEARPNATVLAMLDKS
jgi:hypothetical protein